MVVIAGRAGLKQREGLYDALEAIDARALDEHRHAGVQLGLDAPHQQFRVREPLGAGAEALDRARRQRAERKQPLDPAFARIAADVGVERLPVGAELAHVAEHEPLDACERAAAPRGPARTEFGFAL